MEIGQSDSIMSSHSLQAAVVAGVLVGILDIGMAALINFVSPIIVLKAIASGLLGKSALAGGVLEAIFGLLLQIAMSSIIAAIYLVAAQHVPPLVQQPWIWGPAYGVAIFIVMNFIVVPISAVPYLPKITPYWVVANGAAMIVFGTLVALGARAAVRA